jgi:hypothetical protein
MRKWNMIKRFALVGTFTLVLAAVALPVYAQTHVSVGIGAPFYPPVAVVSAAPYPGYVWQPAHHVWTAFGYQVVPGGWVPAPYVVHRRAYVAPPVVAAPYYTAPYYTAPYYAAPYYAAPYYAAPYYAPRGLSLGFGFNVGHGHHGGHEGHHGRHR